MELRLHEEAKAKWDSSKAPAPLYSVLFKVNPRRQLQKVAQYLLDSERKFGTQD